MPTTDDARSAGRGAVALGVLQAAGRVLALGFFIVATHAVRPTDFGRYSTVAAILLIVGFVSDLGTTTATTKLVSTGTNADTLLSDSLGACFALGLAAWGIGEAVVLAGYPKLLAVDFAVLGASLPIDACLTTIVGALDGSGAIARRATVSAVRVGLGAAIAAVLVTVTGSIRWALAGLVMGPLFGLVLAYITARRLGVWHGRVRLNPRRGWPLLLAAVPYAAITGFSTVSARIDVVVVSIVASRATTAVYDVAVRVLEGPLFIVNVLFGPMLFLFSRRLAADDTEGAQRAFDQVARLLHVCGLGLSVIVVTLATPLVRVFFGGSYDRAGLLLTIFGVQLWLMFLCSLQTMLLASNTQMRRVVVLIAWVDAVAIGTQVAFIIVGGPVGGAASYTVATGFTIIVFARFLQRATGLRTLRPPPWGAIVATLAAGGVAILLRKAQIEIPLAAAGLVYVVTIFALGAVDTNDLARLRRLANRTNS